MGGTQAKQAALELLHQIVGEIRRHRDMLLAFGAPESGEMGWRGYGAIEALRHVGLLDEGERLHWNDRVADVLTAGMPEPHLREASVSTGTPVSATFAAVHAKVPLPQWIHPHRKFSGNAERKLLGVVGDGGSADRPRLQHVELFEDGVVVTWSHPVR